MFMAMTISDFFQNYLIKALAETVYMVFISGIISIFFGIILGALLYSTFKSKNKYLKTLYTILSFFVNVIRSFPFLILVFAIVPITRSIMEVITGVGTSTGNNAAIVPLTVAATPFIAKIIENSLMEVKDDVIEASLALGLSPVQIIFKVVIKEAIPSIVSGLTLSMVSLIGFSAMVCNFGAGGLGGFVYNYGYIMMDNNAMIYGVISIIALVQLVQLLGNQLYKKLK